MSYIFSIDGRVESCNRQNAIKKSFFWAPQIGQTYEVEVYLLNLKINSKHLQEIKDKCEGNMPPFHPTDLELGLTYCFNSETPLQIGDTITIQFEYIGGEFRFVGVDMLI